MTDDAIAVSAPAHILVIDDQEDNVALLDAVLSARGYTVDTALDGPAGLQLAWAHPPDLIVLDLAMPGMDGFEVLEKLRADRRTARTPVIVLTASYRDPDKVERGLALGATEYLTKPLQTEELVVRLGSALRLSAAEKELARLRHDFASMLVHDMRAPLDGVKLALSTLKRQEEEGSRRRLMIEQAVGALAAVGDLMEDLLHTNRLEEEGFTPQIRSVCLADVVEASLLTLQPIAETRDLTLTVEGLSLLPPVQADPGLLRRVIDNLVSNALKFTETGTVRVHGAREGDRVRIGVRDTGPGIPDGAIARIFDRYYHVERRRQTRQGGFGLGLAFCQRAIDAMGGHIGATSLEGAGSEFWFTLPVTG